MQGRLFLSALGLLFLAAMPANSQVFRGIMSIKGAEMSWWGGVARDAIARQYDVEKNTVQLHCATDKGSYRPGTIAFQAKSGRTIDLDKMQESLRATRLSGGTSMELVSLQLTAGGKAAATEKELILTLNGTGQRFVLVEPAGEGRAGEGSAFRKLRELLAKGEQPVVVTGYALGWSGRFPAALKTLGTDFATGKPMRLQVTDFQLVKE